MALNQSKPHAKYLVMLLSLLFALKSGEAVSESVQTEFENDWLDLEQTYAQIQEIELIIVNLATIGRLQSRLYQEAMASVSDDAYERYLKLMQDYSVQSVKLIPIQSRLMINSFRYQETFPELHDSLRRLASASFDCSDALNFPTIREQQSHYEERFQSCLHEFRSQALRAKSLVNQAKEKAKFHFDSPSGTQAGIQPERAPTSPISRGSVNQIAISPWIAQSVTALPTVLLTYGLIAIFLARRLHWSKHLILVTVTSIASPIVVQALGAKAPGADQATVAGLALLSALVGAVMQRAIRTPDTKLSNPEGHSQ